MDDFSPPAVIHRATHAVSIELFRKVNNPKAIHIPATVQYCTRSKIRETAVHLLSDRHMLQKVKRYRSDACHGSL
jgi:hypothetical protein